jgi:amino acid transporter
MAVDFKSLGKFEQGALISGVVAIILSFIGSYVVVSVDGGRNLPGASDGINAWHSWATLGVLLIIAATAIVAIKAFAKDNLPDGVPWNLVALAAAGLGTLLVILRAVFNGVETGGLSGVSVGPGWSGYLLFLAGIALTVFTFLSFKESGEKIPEMNKKNDTPPAPPAA